MKPKPLAFVRRIRWGTLCALASLPIAAAACDSVVDTRPLAPARAAVRIPTAAVQTPTYPASVLFILHREYVHLHPELRSLDLETDKDYQKYLEKRLRKLYPNKGYDGMMNDIAAEAAQLRAQWAARPRGGRPSDGNGLITVQYCRGDELEYYPTEPYYGGDGTVCSGGGGGGSYGSGIGGGGMEPPTDYSWTNGTGFTVDLDYIPTVQEYADSLQTQGDETETLYYYESLADPNNTRV